MRRRCRQPKPCKRKTTNEHSAASRHQNDLTADFGDSRIKPKPIRAIRVIRGWTILVGFGALGSFVVSQSKQNAFQGATFGVKSPGMKNSFSLACLFVLFTFVAMAAPPIGLQLYSLRADFAKDVP